MNLDPRCKLFGASSCGVIPANAAPRTGASCHLTKILEPRRFSELSTPPAAASDATRYHAGQLHMPPLLSHMHTHVLPRSMSHKAAYIHASCLFARVCLTSLRCMGAETRLDVLLLDVIIPSLRDDADVK
jgi:hypothetical protein